MDSFFSRGFKASKCKTLLKLTIPRIKLLKNRREIQIKQMRREIAKLLETGQEATARIRVEHVIREEKMIGAQDIVELFCELITVRLPIIEAQRDCPLDLKEAIASICFAAPRCADLAELQQVQMLFAAKYGKEFVSSATELMPECGVNRQLVELLSIQVPTPDVKLRLLKGIAEEHGLDWDPNASESELLKTHEDLLNGPTQFVNGLKVPLPQHDLANATTLEPSAVKHSEDLLNGSTQSVNGFKVPSPQHDLANETTLESSAVKHSEDLINGSTQSVNGLKVPVPQHDLANATTLEPSGVKHSEDSLNGAPQSVNGFKVPSPQHDLANATTLEPSAVKHSKDLLNGTPQSVNSFKVPSPQHDLANSTTLEPSVVKHSDSDECFDIIDFREVPRQPLQSNKGTVSAPEMLRLPASAPPDIDHENLPHSKSVMKKEASIVSSIGAEDKQFVPFVRPPITRTATDDVDLRDVLAAVQEAAKTAECAAVVAQSAASLAQVRITEFMRRKDKEVSSCYTFRLDNPKLDMDGKAEFEGYPHDKIGFRHHQHQRLASMDEDMYISYPNLFTSQDSY